MVTTRVEVAQYLKDARGLVVFGADGHEVAAIFVQGSVTYDDEEATFIAVAEDGQAVGQLFVDETVGYDGNTDAFGHPYRAIVTGLIRRHGRRKGHADAPNPRL